MSTEEKDDVIMFLEKLIARLESSRYGEDVQFLACLHWAICLRKKEIERGVK